MSYTRKQLNKAIQEKNDLMKEGFKSNPVATMLGLAAMLGIMAGISAGAGALAGLALSFISLPPLIAGGIIGSAMALVSSIISACRFQKTTNLNDISEEHKQILKEYSNSTEYKVKNYVHTIIDIGVFFGIGAGLVALGFTSPAAIGAVTFIAGVVAYYPLNLLIDKAIECFFPEGSKQPSSSVNSDVKVDGTGRNPCPSN